jgi:branched-chain amino acid transport system permease protein
LSVPTNASLVRGLTAILAAAGALALVPLAGFPLFYESFLYLVFHWIVLATSWNILSGYSGYFSFGHGAFFGAGMYTTAVLASRFDVPFLWTLPAAAAVAALMGVALGAVVFRVREIRGELFALVTLAFTFVVGTIVLNTPIDGGPGVYLSAIPVPAIGPSGASSFYYMGLALALVTLITAFAVFHAKFGAGLFAIHDDEDVAEVIGVPTFRYKIAAFAVSCGFAGIAGGIHALFISYVTAGETFSIIVPLTVILMSVLGGSRFWAGPAVGAAVITSLLYAFTASNHAVAGRAVFGAVLIVAILFMPQGVLGWFSGRRREARERSASKVAASTAPTPPIAHRAATGERLLVARGLRKAFRGVQALDRVDMEIRQGEILGLLGPNGSGKSTFINLVSGHFRPDAGEIRFGGRDLSDCDAHAIARSGIARTYQIPRPFAHLTVRENVAMAAMFGSANLSRNAAERDSQHWLDFAGLAPKAGALPDELNLHQRKFLELARALASRPRLVLLDEVLSGLTPTEINEAVGLIRTVRDRGTTIVFVEHLMRAVMALTDRVVVLNHGQVIAEGAASDVMEREEVVFAYLGPPHA